MTTDDSNETSTLVSFNPGRDVQRVGTAASSARTSAKIHDPVWAVIGNLGDSQCYLGVPAKVQAVQAGGVPPHRRGRPAGPADRAGLHPRGLRRPAQRHAADAVLPDRSRAGPRRRRRAPGGQRRRRADRRGGVRQAAGRDGRRRSREQHALGHPLRRLDQAGHRPCDRAPGSTSSRLSRRPDQDDEVRARLALHACPGQGSCGGMFTYNTMQTFIAVLGLEPLHMVSPAVGRPPPPRPNSPTSWSTACSP